MSERRARTKRIIVSLAIFVAGLITGAMWYRARVFPFPQIARLKYQLKVRYFPEIERRAILAPEKYAAGDQLFTDRNYWDEVGDPRLDGLFLIQIPRHTTSDIVIEARKPVTIYRLTSPSNDNSIFDAWNETDIKVKVLGASVLDSVIERDFSPGRIRLKSGGPSSSSPILVKVHEPSEDSIDFELMKE